MTPAKGANPADCKDPACNDTIDMFKKTMRMVSTSAAEATKNKSVTKSNGNQAATAAVVDQLEGCPLSKGELGNATWGVVHTTAAHYPDKPSEELQHHTKAFFTGLAQLYPCTWCRKDFKREIIKDPPSVESRLALSLWACRQHNVVNEKLGKPLFKCTLPDLDERWKTGKKSCWEGMGEETVEADG